MIKIFINTILPLFAIVIFGYVLKKRRIITPEWMNVANKLTYYIAIPAVLIKSLTKIADMVEAVNRINFKLFFIFKTIDDYLVKLISYNLRSVLYASLQISKNVTKVLQFCYIFLE